MYASKRWCPHALVAVLVVLCLSMVSVSTATPFATAVARAATFTVTSTADSGAGSLRQAVLDATDGDTITFNLPVSSTITLTSEIGITKTLTIDASNVTGVTVSGGNATRVFSATAPLTLTGMTIADGNASGNGGGIQSSAALTLTNVIVRDSVASSAGGGVAASGPLAVNGGRFENNRAGSDGGALAVNTLVMSGTDVVSNTAPFGGGVTTPDPTSASITGGMFTDNHGFLGGALAVFSLTLSGTQVMSNTAQEGGGIYTAFASIQHAHIERNSAEIGGGALVLDTTEITSTTLISNTAQDEGGALFIGQTGPIPISANRLSGNGWPAAGARISAPLPHSTIRASRLFDNTAVNDGSAIYLASVEATLENNFISGSTGVNGAPPIVIGAPTPMSSPSSLIATHNTFVAAQPGSGVAIRAGRDIAGDTVALTNTIFADYGTALQTGPNPATITADGVLFSNVTTPTERLNNSGAITITHAYTGTAAFVNPAARNYHLTGASVAIDKGVPTSVTTDIDGQTRPQGSAPDLGADEFSNTPPTAVNDSYTTAEDTPLSVPAPGVLGNDSDMEGDVLTATLQTAPTTGTLTLNPDGSFTYTPPANFNGSVTFTYVAGDGNMPSQPATVTITVTPVNDPPTISNIANQTTSMGTAVGPISFTVSDADGDPLTVTASSSNTTLVPNANIVLSGSGANRTVTVTPAAGQRGTTTITITVSDGKTQTTATFTLTVGDAVLHLPIIMK